MQPTSTSRDQWPVLAAAVTSTTGMLPGAAGAAMIHAVLDVIETRPSPDSTITGQEVPAGTEAALANSDNVVTTTAIVRDML